MITVSNLNDERASQDSKNTVIHDTYNIRELDIEKIYDILYRWFHNQIRMRFIDSEKPVYMKAYRTEDKYPVTVHQWRCRFTRKHVSNIPSIFVINLKEMDDSVIVEVRINLVDEYEKLQYSQYKQLQIDNIKKIWFKTANEFRTLLNKYLEEKLDLLSPYFKKSPVNQ